MSKSPEYRREYYLKNKDKWAKYITYVHCDLCNKDVKKDHYNSTHLKSQKHVRIVETKAKKEQELAALTDKIRTEILQNLREKIII